MAVKIFHIADRFFNSVMDRGSFVTFLLVMGLGFIGAFIVRVILGW